MKRLFSLLLCALLLAGCAPKGPEPATLPATSLPPVTSQPETVPPTTLPPETIPPETEPRETMSAETLPPEPTYVYTPAGDDALVRIRDFLPNVSIRLAYATENNFTGQIIYDFTEGYLRYGTLKKLEAAAAELEERGLYLLIWDALRPVSAQEVLWQVCPDPTYVANPSTGASSHSRGNTLDLTLTDGEGNLLEMPTGFDDFSPLADRDYSDCTPEAREHAQLLQDTMERHGFTGYFGEWWHFSDTQSYDVAREFQAMVPETRYADCKEFISLRSEPKTNGKVLAEIPAGEVFPVLARDGKFLLAVYEGKLGYVLASYTDFLTEAKPQVWAANCREYISLKAAPGGEVLEQLPNGTLMVLLAWAGRYAYVEYDGMFGYVLSSYIRPQEDSMQSILSTVAPTDVYSYEQMRSDMEALVRQHPETMSLSTLGTSELDRDIPVLLLGNPEGAHQIFFLGAVHGREHMTAWLLMALADAARGENWEDVCLHIVPMVNPDGVTVSQTEELDDAQTAIFQGDRKAYRTYKEKEQYASLWKANGLGIDINRSFPCGWEDLDEVPAEPSSEGYPGEAPFQAAEARALRDYTLAHDFDATVSLHASGSLIYCEYGDRTAVNARSRDLARQVADLTGYPLRGSAGVTGAGYKDWAIDELGIPSLTIEIGCSDAPLHQRELHAIFARNLGLFETVSNWVTRQ